MTVFIHIIFSGLILISTLFSKQVSFVIVALVSLLGWWFGLLELSALVFIALYLVFNYFLLTLKLKHPGVKFILYLVWTLLSAALILHLVPGFNNLLLAEDIQLKNQSLITSFYWNLDKVLVAWAASLFVSLWYRSTTVFTHVSSFLLLPIVFVIFSVIFGLGLFADLIAMQVQWHPLIPVLLFANLVNTCFAEELIFRGLLQNFFVTRFGAVTGLLLASIVFGLAHFSGGPAYIVLAILAGLAYGLVYLVTGRLYWAVITHFSFNVLHMTLFTYPLMVH